MSGPTASNERIAAAAVLLDAAVVYVRGVRANKEAGDKFGYGSAQHQEACRCFFEDERTGRNNLVAAAQAYAMSADQRTRVAPSTSLSAK